MPGSANIAWTKNLPQLATPVLTATSASTTQIDLSWADVANESSYKIEWSASGVGGWTQIGGTIAAGSTSYSHTGASANTLYFYRITAVGDNINYIDSDFGYANERTRGTALSITQTVTNTAAGGTVNIALTGVAAGATLVFMMAQENSITQAAMPFTVSSSPALTWARRSTHGADASGNSEIWTAVFSAGGSITCTSVLAAANISGTVSEVANVESVINGAQAFADSQTNPSVNITTTRYGSIVFGVTCDFTATDGTTRTLRDSATELFYTRVAGAYTAYFYYKSVTTISTRTMGVSAPSMTSNGGGTCLYEIRTA